VALKGQNLIIYTDGVSRGNPGDAGIGVVLKDKNGAVVDEIGKYIGTTTNNVAEYTALINALEYAVKHKTVSADIFLDSELVVRQMNGVYRVKDENLALLFNKAQALIKKIRVKGQGSRVTLTHIPREKNKEADNLANKAVNLHLSKK